jgi:hypothetical protein
MGDLDGDNDLDIYVANGNTSSQADEVWINNGGVFSSTGQQLDLSWNEGVALGDLDGDNDLDVFIATWFGADAVWLNDGDGNLSDSGQTLSLNGSMDVALVDVDDDDDLDAIVGKWTPSANEIWLNNGDGLFTMSPESLDSSATYEVAAGDLDADNDSDLVFGNFGANHVWFKAGSGPLKAWFDVDARTNLLGQTVFPWAHNADAMLTVELSFPPLDAVEVLARIESAGGTLTKTLPFASGQMAGILEVVNPMPDLQETYSLTLSVAQSLIAPLEGLENPLNLVFIDREEGDVLCSLCYVDWLLKILGFDTSFWSLHHMQLPILRESLSWTYYQGLFTSNANELSLIIATHPALLWQSFDALETWTPAVQALDDGNGDQVIITQSMIDEMVAALDGIAGEAAPALAARIRMELDALDPDSFVGLTIDEVSEQIAGRIEGLLYLPVVRASENG